MVMSIDSMFISSRQNVGKKILLDELVLASQVGGVHFSLLSKVRHDIGDTCSLDHLIDSIFPLFRKHIEPDLHHAQVGCCAYLHVQAYMFIWLFIPSLGYFDRLESTIALFHLSRNLTIS